MKNAKVSLCLAFLFSSSAFAIDCDNAAVTAKAQFQFPGAGYWMQSAGDCRVTYTGIGGIGNNMYNTCTRKKEDITNGIDAYGLPQGDLYVQPTKGISFFKTSEGIAKGSRANPIYSDESMYGNYESVGTLPGSTDDKRTVRVSMGSAGGRFRDYVVQKQGEEYSVSPIQPSPLPVCKNLASGGLDEETPILSRDGQMIAAREYQSRKTKVYKIDTATGNCTEYKTIPNQTSKVSFSFDNQKLMYTIKDPKSNNLRLAEFNMNTGKRRILTGPDEDVMYMSYKPDGSIMYTRRRADISYHNAESSDLIVLDPKNLPEAGSEPERASEALGFLWASSCKKTVDADAAGAIGSRLSKSSCKDIVTTENIAALPNQYQGLGVDDLNRACGSSTRADGPTSTVPTSATITQ